MEKKKAAKLLIGAHCSAAGGVHKALLEGQEIGATTIQLFTANQRQWTPKEPSEEEITLWHKAMAETGMQQVMSHASYLINLAAPDPENLQKSREAFRREILRCQALGVSYLNFHPGSSLKSEPEACLDRIAQSLLLYEDLLLDDSLMLLFENTAGQGSNLGHSFEELAYLVQAVEKRLPVGICIDTCHAFAAGYDMRTQATWKQTIEEFDQVVGLRHLRAFHVNDSKKELGSRRDRHEVLGEGEIGIEAFRLLMQDARTRGLPKYLETPRDLKRWSKEIEQLRQFAIDGPA